jgi:hypothetical protein
MQLRRHRLRLRIHKRLRREQCRSHALLACRRSTSLGSLLDRKIRTADTQKTICAVVGVPTRGLRTGVQAQRSSRCQLDC